jgi:hypothetical protein
MPQESQTCWMRSGFFETSPILKAAFSVPW